jgi:hypothetical protein
MSTHNERRARGAHIRLSAVVGLAQYSENMVEMMFAALEVWVRKWRNEPARGVLDIDRGAVPHASLLVVELHSVSTTHRSGGRGDRVHVAHLLDRLVVAGLRAPRMANTPIVSSPT